MAGLLGVKVIGTREAIVKLAAINRIARIEVGLAIRATAEEMVKIARSNIHSESGNLASGVQAKYLGPYTWEVSASSRAGDVPDKNDKEYAPFVEYGTSKMGARPFLRPAAIASEGLLQASMVAIARHISSL